MVAFWIVSAAVIGALAQGGQTAERPRLELTVYPSIGTAPATVRATATVARHPANQALTMTADCPRYLRRTTIELDGRTDALTHILHFDALPACTYEISATLDRSDGPDIRDALSVVVIE